MMTMHFYRYFMHFDLNFEINCVLKCVVCSIHEFSELYSAAHLVASSVINK